MRQKVEVLWQNHEIRKLLDKRSEIFSNHVVKRENVSTTTREKEIVSRIKKK